MLRHSVAQTRRRSATSWRPAWKTISTSGSARTSASGAGAKPSWSGASTSTRGSPPRPAPLAPRLVARAGALFLDRDLDEAQQRPVAALAHELGVDAQPPARACEA